MRSAGRPRSGRLDWEQWAGKVLGALGEDRAAVAQVLGCQAAEIALCESTTAAMNVFFCGASSCPLVTRSSTATSRTRPPSFRSG